MAMQVDEGDDDDDAMDDDGAPAGPEPSDEFKQRVLGVLQSADMDGQRSSKLGQDHFLRLLAVFNAAGVHFA